MRSAAISIDRRPEARCRAWSCCNATGTSVSIVKYGAFEMDEDRKLDGSASRVLQPMRAILSSTLCGFRIQRRGG